MIKIYTILFFICSISQGYSQEIIINEGTIIPKDQIIVTHFYNASIPGWTPNPFPADPPDPDPPELYREFLTGTVRLIYDRSEFSDVDDKYWGLRIEYDVLDENGTTILFKDQQIVIQAFDSKGIYEAENRHIIPTGTYQIEITGIFVSLDNWATETDSYLSFIKRIPYDIHLQVSIELEKYNYVDQLVAIDFNDILITQSMGKIKVQWPMVREAEKYELQWIYNDNEFVDNEIQSLLLPIKNGQTVEVIRPEYEMYVTYPPGKLIFRVRPVGRFIQGLDPNLEKIVTGGRWSGSKVYEYDGFNENHIWQSQTTYAEEGKYKKVVQYFDDGLKNRQVVTNLSTDDIVLRTSSHYDYEGRPVANVLPVPDFTINRLDYHTDFNVLEPGNFDNNLVPPQAISSLSGASFYYSSANTTSENIAIHNSYLPGAGGYPYTLMKYLNDGTGRPRAQSGVGPQFAIGSGHETRYFYDDPSEYQLKRLFGDNVGKAKYYLRNITQDPNHQLSVSYIDNAGRTIATALLGASPENVQPLDNVPETAEITKNLIDKNIILPEEGISRVISTVFIESLTDPTVHINYSVTGIQIPIGTECIGCKYLLNISVIDPDGEITTCGIQDLVIEVSDGCSTVPEVVVPELTCSFDQIGTYTIIKELKVIERTTEEWKEILIANGELPDIEEYITYYESLIDENNCNEVCADYCQDAADVDECIMECLSNMLTEGSEIPCEAILQNMRLQMAPGGCRYDDWINNQTILASLEFVYNGVTVNGADEQFHMVLTNPDIQWESSWYDVVVTKHPEYCYYTFCLSTETSRKFDLELTVFNKWDLLSANDQYVLDLDPFFNGGPGENFKSDMKGQLDDYIPEIDNAASCANMGIDMSLVELILCRMPNGSDDDKWAFYTGVYLGLKNNYVNKAQAIACSNLPYDADCTVKPAELPTTLFDGDADVDDALDFLNENGIPADCPDACESNAEFLADEILGLCDLNDSEIRAELIEKILAHCLVVCGYQNPFGLILDEDAELPTYIYLMNYISGLDCAEADIIDIISNAFDDVYLGVGEPQDAGIDIFIDACLGDTLDLFPYHDSLYQASVDSLLLDSLLGTQTYLLDTGLYYFIGYDSTCCDTFPLMTIDTAVFSWFPGEVGGIIEDTFYNGYDVGMHPKLVFNKPGCYRFHYYAPTPPGACSDMSEITIYVPDCKTEAEIVIDSITTCQVSATIVDNHLCPDIDTVIWTVIVDGIDTLDYVEGDSINLGSVYFFHATVIFKSSCCDTLFLADTMKCECPDFTITGSTSDLCYFAPRTFGLSIPESPNATYSWDFGVDAVPTTSNSYGPHEVYYTSGGSKTVFVNVTDESFCENTAVITFTVDTCVGNISGKVQNINGNGIQGVNVRLYPDTEPDGIPNGTFIKNIFTNASGNFLMTFLTPGNYVIVEIQPNTWLTIDDYDSSDDGDIVANNDDPVLNRIPCTILPLESDADNIFVETPQPGIITGIVFEDKNFNETYNTGEEQIGITVELHTDTDSNGNPDNPSTPYATTLTTTLGNFNFNNVPIGNYVLYQINAAGLFSKKDIDLTNDNDVVANSNTNDDLIPVTIINGETDAGNTFIDVCDPDLTLDIEPQVGCIYGIYFENPDDPEEDYAAIEISSNSFTVDVSVQCIVDNINYQNPELECLGEVESVTLTRPIIMGKVVSIDLENGDTPNQIKVSDGTNWHTLDISYAAYDANCSCADCGVGAADFVYDDTEPEVFLYAVTQSIISAFCEVLSANNDEHYKLITQLDNDVLKIYLANKNDPSGSFYYFSNSSGNVISQPVILRNSTPVDGELDIFISYYDNNQLNSNYTWDEWCEFQTLCGPISNTPYFDDYGTWNADLHGTIEISNLELTGTPNQFTINCPGILFAETNCPDPEFLWSTGATTQYILVGPEFGIYTVTVTCGDCQVNDSQTVPGNAANPGENGSITGNNNLTPSQDEDGFIIVYPNPANHFFYIDFYHSYSIPDEFDVMMYDISGQLLYTEEYSSMGNNDRVKINSSSFPAGIYLVGVTDQKAVYSKAIVIIN